MNYFEEFNEHVDENGVEGLLPQNLTNSILDRMLIGIEGFENDAEDAQVVTIIFAIFSIKQGGRMDTSIEMNFDDGEDFIKIFNSYVACLKQEGMRRSTSLTILDNALPTLKNIFDKDRKVYISRLD